MSTYAKYPINVNLIPNLPLVPFRNGKAEGVVLHATATFNDTAIGERNFEAGSYNNAFVHTFTDHTQVLEVASFAHGAYGAGPTANHRYLHNELCQSADATKFAQGYDRWVWLAARQLFDLGLAPKDKVTLWSHVEVSQAWHESNHSDPIDYLASHGKTWANVVADVTNYYNAMVAEKKAPAPAPAPTNNTTPSSGTVSLPKTATTWTVYKLGHPCVKSNPANVAGVLAPSRFGGLTYAIKGTTGPDTYIIHTDSFGDVQIYAAASTGAIVKK
jgi:N-acetylmuramoyl-L-alanine amidase CwlA